MRAAKIFLVVVAIMVLGLILEAVDSNLGDSQDRFEVEFYQHNRDDRIRIRIIRDRYTGQRYLYIEPATSIAARGGASLTPLLDKGEK